MKGKCIMELKLTDYLNLLSIAAHAAMSLERIADALENMQKGVTVECDNPDEFPRMINSERDIFDAVQNMRVKKRPCETVDEFIERINKR